MEEEKKVELSVLHIGFLYIGALMGAGFASGKEMWQFFGVFGRNGIFGLCLITLIFMGFGYMTVTIARALRTNDMSKLIFPMDNKTSETLVGIIMSVFLFMAYFSMLAAGGALFHEQFGIHRFLGSLLLMFLAVLTAINGFEVVSKRLQKVTPILISGTLILCLLIMIKNNFDFHPEVKMAASPLASNWFIAAIAFVSYNLTGAIPMLGSCAIHAKSKNTAQKGAVLGGIFLGTCSLILYLTTLTDPFRASESSLPMLVLCEQLASWVRMIYAVVLLIAVFSTATSTFYGITTKLPETKNRKLYIWILAVIGFGMSLFGFSNLVAFMYPIGGYCGLIFLVFMVVNFIRVQSGKRNFHEEIKEDDTL
ncbi:hypothetical protein [Sinanaerobacter sp. ZZT-01]|uniref:YkvI family membrane protein n=1 Tax=Sinanaerobacter sp. ZZT-01 TaxID=3111540 RepID=UPI002D76C370|nr:hypothetical protein [Sinanaerobacter sp. ZZT-01]WRR93328.1 hypothetical protein U5921_15060 [Sinanaerobacter sp. ZZT-01]